MNLSDAAYLVENSKSSEVVAPNWGCVLRRGTKHALYLFLDPSVMHLCDTKQSYRIELPIHGWRDWKDVGRKHNGFGLECLG